MFVASYCRWRVAALVGVAVLMGGVPMAAAGLSDVVLRIEAANGRASGFLEFTQEDGWWEGNIFYWQTQVPLEICDANGGLIGTFGPAAITSYVVPGRGRANNPQVNLGFAMQAGDAPTAFTVKSALLSFDPMVNPDARATVGINVSDAIGDGATLTGNGPNGGSYLAQYNGFVPDGTAFAELVQSVVVLDPFGTGTGAGDSGWVQILDTVYDMSAEITFTLTEHDLASGTSTFQLVPEPSSLLLVVAGLAFLRRR
jgi:hypothetical protein